MQAFVRYAYVPDLRIFTVGFTSLQKEWRIKAR